MIEIKINKYTDGFRVKSSMISKSGQALWYTGRVEHGQIIVELWSDNLAEHYREPFGYYRPYAVVGSIRHGWCGVLRLNPAFAAMQCCSDRLAALLAFTGAAHAYSKMFYKYRRVCVSNSGVRTEIEKIVGLDTAGTMIELTGSDFIDIPDNISVIIIKEIYDGKVQFKLAANGYEAFKTIDTFVNKIKNIIKGK